MAKTQKRIKTTQVNKTQQTQATKNTRI